MTQTQFHMPGEFPVGGFELREGEVLRITDPRSVLVKIVTGRAWVTEERAQQDVVLGAGERIRLGQPGAAVIEAWEHTTVLLTSPFAREYAREVTLLPRPGGARLRIGRARHPWRAVGAAALVFAQRLWRAIAPTTART